MQAGWEEGMTDSDLKAAGWIVDVGEWSHPLMPGTQLQGMNIWAAGEAEGFARARISAALRPLVDAWKSVAAQLRCSCDEAWTSRGLHSTECHEYIAEEMDDAIADAERRLT